MYIGGVGTTGLHHLVWEILDNSIDEAMNGYASNIAVALHKDAASITIQDDGRGIPVDKHPQTKTSAMEVIFTTLHAGGKFEGQNYKTAGGLHGVGASVVNALSRELVATVRRDGATYEQKYKQGEPVGGVKKIGPARGTGTTVFFRPDPQIFPKTEFDAAVIRERLEIASYLHKGLKINFENEAATGDEPKRETFQHDEGISAYLAKLLKDRHTKPVHEAPFALTREHEESGMKLDLVMQWTEATDEHLKSYVNGIPTASGGTHENGLRGGLGKAIRNFIDTHNLSPKGVTLTADDIREGVVGVLSIFIKEPQFQGQTKDRLNNPEVTAIVDSVARPALEHWLNSNKSIAESIVARIILAARAREASRAAQAEVVAQERDVVSIDAAGQAQRLHELRPRGERDLHRRGRFGRRIGEAGPGPRPAGDSAAARQGAEHRRRVGREGAREQGAVGSRDGARLRHRQGLRVDEAAVRPRHHPGRRGFGRPSHRDAAADVHLPAHAAAHPRGQGLPRAAAALSHRHREGDALGARRQAQGRHPQARRRQGQNRHHPVQGPRRDDAEGAVGDDAQSAHAASAARRDRRIRFSPTASSTSSWARTRPRASGSSWSGRKKRKSWTSKSAFQNVGRPFRAA